MVFNGGDDDDDCEDYGKTVLMVPKGAVMSFVGKHLYLQVLGTTVSGSSDGGGGGE